MDFFAGKVAVITGGSSGIGLATARLLADRKAKLVIAARSMDRLVEAASELAKKTEVLPVRTDVQSEADCRNLIDKAVERFGRIDILVNNAGVSMRAMFRDLDLSVIRRSMDVNFYGTVYCTKYALPYLLESKGTVVGVISVAGFKGLPGRTGYSASKFAVYGFLDALRVEHLYDGLHVMLFAPGFTASNIRKSAMTADGSPQGESPRDEGKMMTAEQCARHMLSGIRRRKRRMVLTLLGKITVFFNKFSPGFVDRVEWRVMAREPDSPLRMESGRGMLNRQ
ncbi:MAG TPA: SDR family oxidoreductase [Candidatus Coprenecus stercoripullorum]|nr:SDR family oxidoreductase [Candidatus Coprenecus stercoripullorum]